MFVFKLVTMLQCLCLMNLERILKAIILGGLFAALFTPLVVTNSLFFPFITGKAFFFRIIIEVIFGAWLLLVLTNTAYRPRFTALLLAVVGLMVVTTLSTIFSVNPPHSFWSNFERMDGLLLYLHLLAYFLVLSSMLRTEKLWKWFFNSSIVVSLAVCIYGLVQLSGALVIHQGGGRVDATLGNAIYLAVYLLLHIFITLFFLWRTQRLSVRLFYGLAIVLQVVVLYYTATRGAIIGLVGGAVIVLVLSAAVGKNIRLRRWSGVGLLLIAVLVGGLFLMRGSQFVKGSAVLSRFADISLSDGTVESRLGIWKMSLEGFKEHPILGWGPDNFGLVFAKYYQPSFWKQEPWFDRSHNIFFDWLINAGLLGLLSYLLLFVVALVYVWRRGGGFSSFEKSLFTGLLGGYFLQNIFVFDNLVSYILFFTILTYIQWQSVSALAPDTNDDRRRSFSWPVAASFPLMIVILVGGGLYFFNVKPLLANRALINGMSSGTLEDRFDGFQKALSYKTTLGQAEISEQLMRLVLQVIPEPQLSDSAKVMVAQAAIKELAQASERSPLDPRPALLAGAFLVRIGQYDEALSYLQRAEKLSPRKQLIIFELAALYNRTGNQKEALHLAEKAYRSDPLYDEARYVYMLQLIYTGQIKEADKLLQSRDILDTRFINAYADAGQINRVLEIWQEHIVREPDNAQYRFNIAATYLRLGKRAEAIKELEEAKRLDPSTEKQVASLIKDIRAGKDILTQ